MAKNDLILLDALVQQAADRYPPQPDKGTLFEFFVLDNLFKDFDLSFDEIQDAWVDGGDDGGIDGFFLFVDGLPLTEVVKAADVRKHPVIEVVLVTCKHEESFRQIPINNLLATITDIFDLSKQRADLIAPYNEDVLDQRDLFCETFKELAGRQPTLRISYCYASRGDASHLPENVSSRGDAVIVATQSLFSDCDVSFKFLGAAELLTQARKQRTTNLRLTFIENFVSRAKSNYVVLVKLADYYRFITDDEGHLRRYLFESNVRDFLGRNPVNDDIAESLGEVSRIDQCDFWWLNNGVTIIATAANSAGKELSLENIQIVNGLQTTETLFAHFSNIKQFSDDRAILVKIIVTKDEEVRDRIIKATNFQTAVDATSLRATEKIQRDIEDLLIKENWFYDRRKNFHRNQGRPIHRIVTPPFVASAISALVDLNLTRAAKMKAKFMQNEIHYRKTFDAHRDMRVFLAVVQIVKSVEEALFEAKLSLPGHSGRRVSDFRWLFSILWVASKVQAPRFSFEQLLNLHKTPATKEEVQKIWAFMCAQRIAGSFNEKRMYRNQAYLDKMLAFLGSNGFTTLG